MGCQSQSPGLALPILFDNNNDNDGVEVRRIWAEYFEQVLNVADVEEANTNVLEILRC